MYQPREWKMVKERMESTNANFSGIGGLGEFGK